MDHIARDLRFALRAARRNPGFTLVTVLTLALGIGANSAVFSLVNGILIRPLPYPDAQELIVFRHAAPGLGLPRLGLSGRDLVSYEQVVTSVEGIGLSVRATADLAGEGEPERLSTARVAGDFFAVLGVPPAIGRPLQPDDNDPFAVPAVVVSHGFWARRFGADNEIAGRTVQLNGITRQIVGVMPRAFAYPHEDTDVWLPDPINEASPPADHVYTGIARMRPGVGIDNVRDDFRAGIDNLANVAPEVFTPAFLERAGFAPVIEPLGATIIGDVAAALWILLGTVGFVLLIACANVANLFLVRAEGAQHDRAVREALGASRFDLVRAHLVESSVLAAMAGTVGLAVGTLGLRLTSGVASGALPRLDQVGLDLNVLAFTALVTVVAAALFGMLPALRYGTTIHSTLGTGALGLSGNGVTQRIRSSLVVVQVAVALVLLVGAGLMARSFRGMRAVDPGFATQGVFTARISLPEGSFRSAESVGVFFQNLIDEVRALPTVVAAGAVSRVPLGPEATITYGFEIQDVPRAPDEPPSRTNAKIVAPGYFETMGIDLLDGRVIGRADHASVTNAIVINQAMADEFWPEVSPIGRRIRHGGVGNWLTVVGVVGAVRDRSLAEEPESLVYMAMVDTPGAITDDPRALTLVVRTEGDPLALIDPVKNLVWSVNRNIPVADYRAMDEIVESSMVRMSFTMTVLGIAAAMALALGSIGLYGVIAYIVSQRTREIGVRMALGAEAGSVRWLVLRRGLTLATIGVAIGFVGSLGVSRMLQSFLFEVAPFDPLTYSGVALLLIGVAFVASYWPARRASQVDPIVAMRAVR